MKKLLIFGIALLLVGIVQAQGEITLDSDGLAQVSTRRGVQIYVMSEPVRDYEVVGDIAVNDATSILKALDGQEDGRSFEQKIDALLQNARKRSKKWARKNGDGSYDAIITADGEEGIAIRFTE